MGGGNVFEWMLSSFFLPFFFVLFSSFLPSSPRYGDAEYDEQLTVRMIPRIDYAALVFACKAVGYDVSFLLWRSKRGIHAFGIDPPLFRDYLHNLQLMQHRIRNS